MKTAISLPNDLYLHTARAARRRGLTRSRFIAQALAAYLESIVPTEITARLDAVHGDRPDPLDPGLGRMQSRSVVRERW